MKPAHTTPSWPRPVPVVGDTTSSAERVKDPSGWRFSEHEREALYEIIAARRDVRRFRPDGLDPQLVRRLLGAAHAAPSVGHSQPWRFVVVTDPTTRDRAALIAERERLRQAALLNEDDSRHMLDLQLDGIREAPLGIVVCCDRRHEPGGVLGQATFVDADLWSCACAIENLWLAARAEGLGLGWVTLFPPEELAELIALPPGIETLGWLCVGWPDERPPGPGLERAGWSHREDLDAVVVLERWDSNAPSPPLSRLRAPGQDAVVDAHDDADALLTPPGSLGALDRALDRLGALGITSAPRAALVLVGADHPVARHAVSTYSPEVTREVLEAALENESIGATAAAVVGLELCCIDAGVLGLAVCGAKDARPLFGRGDLVEADALDARDVERLVSIGQQLAQCDVTAPLVAIGEVGVANTTVAAVLAALLTDLDPAEFVGLGAGGDADTLSRKSSVVTAAACRARHDHPDVSRDPLVVLASGGGPEFAVLAGVILGAASRGGAIVLDGFATSVAAFVATRLEPAVSAHLLAAQRSRERGHKIVLDELGLEALLDLRLRAGEGVGAVLGTQLLLTALQMRELTARVTDHPPQTDRQR